MTIESLKGIQGFIIERDDVLQMEHTQSRFNSLLRNVYRSRLVRKITEVIVFVKVQVSRNRRPCVVHAAVVIQMVWIVEIW